MASKTNSKNNISPKPDRNYSLIKAIRQEKEYKHNVLQRDVAVRKFLISECKVTSPQDAIPGQLISFNYLKPKYKDELEYYDAMPMTIFFGVFKSKEGRRVLGFNLHYYPPRIRYRIMDRILEIWKPMYFKVWNEGLKKDLNHFDYVWLTEQLEKIGLSFGVRMYIPELIAQIRVVPPKFWSKAVFTEGVFKKKTRQMILNYWKKFTLKETQTTS
jgi:hypothetical protein